MPHGNLATAEPASESVDGNLAFSGALTLARGVWQMWHWERDDEQGGRIRIVEQSFEEFFLWVSMPGEVLPSHIAVRPHIEMRVRKANTGLRRAVRSRTNWSDALRVSLGISLVVVVVSLGFLLRGVYASGSSNEGTRYLL